MKYEKFDVKRALAGEPVILRDGSKAYVKYQESELVVKYPILGFDVDGYSHSWDNLGKVLRGTRHSNDIVGMYPKKPLTMPDSFWEVFDAGIVAIAMDTDGAWGDGLFHYHLETYPQEIFPACNPKDSLILRPTGDSL